MPDTGSELVLITALYSPCTDSGTMLATGSGTVPKAEARGKEGEQPGPCKEVPSACSLMIPQRDMLSLEKGV